MPKDINELSNSFKKIEIKLESTLNSIGRQTPKSESFNTNYIRYYMKNLIEELKIYDKLKLEISKATGHSNAAINAYGDLHGLKTRDLMWNGPFTTAKKASNAMIDAVPDGYNEFNAKEVARKVNNFSHYKWSFGRENSPVLYCSKVNSKIEVEELVRQFESVKADEIMLYVNKKPIWSFDNRKEIPDFKSGIMRFWWD